MLPHIRLDFEATLTTCSPSVSFIPDIWVLGLVFKHATLPAYVATYTCLYCVPHELLFDAIVFPILVNIEI